MVWFAIEFGAWFDLVIQCFWGYKFTLTAIVPFLTERAGIHCPMSLSISCSIIPIRKLAERHHTCKLPVAILTFFYNAKPICGMFPIVNMTKRVNGRSDSHASGQVGFFCSCQFVNCKKLQRMTCFPDSHRKPKIIYKISKSDYR
jgi:hypothetical protein